MKAGDADIHDAGAARSPAGARGGIAVATAQPAQLIGEVVSTRMPVMATRWPGLQSSPLGTLRF
jgi:hypothetical protein